MRRLKNETHKKETHKKETHKIGAVLKQGEQVDT